MDKVPLPGTDIPDLPGSHRIGAVPPDQSFTVTIMLRPRSGGGQRFPQRWRHKILSREQFAALHGADPKDIAQVELFANQNNLTVKSVDPGKRAIALNGSAGDINKAFEIELGNYEFNGKQFVCYTGTLHVKAELVSIIQGILGLDGRPVLAPAQGAGSPTTSAIALAYASLVYSFPTGTGADGSGQTVGILCVGGGYNRNDLVAFFDKFSMPVPTIVDVPTNGNNPGQNIAANSEIEEDIEIFGFLAPAATIVVYFAPGFSLDDLVTAFGNAVNDSVNAPSVISISLLTPEALASAAHKLMIEAIAQNAADLGITVFAGSGDDGADSGVGIPASCPHVTGCGGTVLTFGGSPPNEIVWPKTGGGVSDFYPDPVFPGVPPYQTLLLDTGVIPFSLTNLSRGYGRAVPDVASHANGFAGGVTPGNPNQLLAGTSASAPLWAALIILINQVNGVRTGFLNPVLYGNLGPAGALQDIISGSNGLYSAGPGWDACTGWGSPNGGLICKLLGPPSVTSVSPNAAPMGGGTPITITGSRFTGATEVDFGDVQVLQDSFTVADDNTINVTAPPQTAFAISAGGLDVTVKTQFGTSTQSSVDLFNYLAPVPGVSSVQPNDGTPGTTVAITGIGFTGVTGVSFNGVAATNVVPDSNNPDTQLTVVSPPGSGTVDITVTTPGGTSAPTSADQFTYVFPVPQITGISPSSGPQAGGTTVTVTGTGFTGVIAVNFNGNPATNIVPDQNNPDTQLTADSPPGNGTVDVAVTTPGGTSAPSSADQFTYQ